MTLIKPAARVGMGQNKALKTTPLKWPPHGMQHAKMPHGSLGISRLHLNGAYIYVGLHVYWYYVCMYVCIWPGIIWRCGCSTENPSGKCKTLATLNERLERGTSFPIFPFAFPSISSALELWGSSCFPSPHAINGRGRQLFPYFVARLTPD